jgi:hypothetical protein
MAPELACKVTGTPESKLLFASFTIAEIVAGFEPSEGICGELVRSVIVRCVATTVTVV